MKVLTTSILSILFLSLICCHTIKDMRQKKPAGSGDTITLPIGVKFEDPNRFAVQFDSVVGDSRCPKGVRCIWEGNAVVKIKFHDLQLKRESSFTLDTHQFGRQFTNDTVVDNYYIKLLELNPYPNINKKVRQRNYSIKIIVKENF